MLTESEMELPTFAPCQTADYLEFYVVVAWPNGARARINHFGTLKDAQGWIARESANWLEIRAQTRLRAQSNEGENPIVLRAARTQILQAA
jgi:hypothetical protein